MQVSFCAVLLLIISTAYAQESQSIEIHMTMETALCELNDFHQILGFPDNQSHRLYIQAGLLNVNAMDYYVRPAGSDTYNCNTTHPCNSLDKDLIQARAKDITPYKVIIDQSTSLTTQFTLYSLTITSYREFTSTSTNVNSEIVFEPNGRRQKK
ncbi:MAG: hypothetical protein EZS28_025742 [Streblomastix strix]|uniref:Uncharacterized protein n=1 Tax=Streblomastix strix TaxID=222440 RepID=A0A5J4V8C1_9EUKA|nr:MAG: hypothetical protein EZS28_025742 [Streblomastix strix]